MLTCLRTNQRRGISLVELLVVIAVIGVLMALLLPAVQAARENARRTSCTNNLKNLGLAAQYYHDNHCTFPPGAVGPLAALPQFANLKQHAAGVFLLPYLEQQALASQYRWDDSWWDPPNQRVVTVRLKIWQCPSAQPNRITDGSLPTTVTPPPEELFSGTAACGDYAGMGSVDAGLEAAGLIDSTAAPRDPRGHYEGILPANAARRLAEVTDGSSQTILIAECAGRPQRWRRRRPDAADVRLSGGGWASRNLLWCRGAVKDGTKFLGTCAVNCTNDREVYSFHTSGAGTVYVDGSVHFLKDNIDIRHFAPLVTYAGGEVVSAD